MSPACCRSRPPCWRATCRRPRRSAASPSAIRRSIRSSTPSRFPPRWSRTIATSEALPFGSRGGTAIRYLFPLDGEYSIKVVLKRQLYLYLLGMGEPHQIDVRLDGVLIKRFTVGGEGKGMTAPESFAGNTQGDPDWEVYMHTADAGPRGARPGEGGHARGGRLVREETPGAGRHPAAAAEGLCPDHERVVLRRAGGGLRPDRWSVPRSGRGRHAEPPEGVRLPAHQQRCRRAVREENSLDPRPPGLSAARDRRGGPDAARVLQSRAEPRAASMPASNEASSESWPLRAFCSGSSVSRRTLRRARPTASPTSTSRRGCRSFSGAAFPTMSCSTRPWRGRLKDPAVLEQQVRRMLRDPRAQALVDNFANQWLKLGKIAGVVPDVDEFPDFDENLREAMRQETQAVHRQSAARRPQRARPADRRLHVRERAAGAALRDSRTSTAAISGA